jgi:predicted DNA-binding transcriptional regulator AlpA
VTGNNASVFMLKPEVEILHPVHDRVRKRAEAQGMFPRRVQLAPHTPGWRRSEVNAWNADPRGWADAMKRGASLAFPVDLAEDL